LDPEELVALSMPGPRRHGDALVAPVRYVDHFGNVQLNAAHGDLAATGLALGRAVVLTLPDDSAHQAQYVRTFSDAGPGELLVYEDASRRLAVAVAQGDAARTLGLAVDDELEIRAR
jgi:S-adenosylmethionine hydrolase